MEPVKLLYPNNYFWNTNNHDGPNFHWALCGKKIWSSEAQNYILELSSSARFFDLKTGKTYKIRKKDTLSLLMLGSLPKQEIFERVLDKIRDLNLDGAVISTSNRYDFNGAWCPSTSFIFLKGLVRVKNIKKCPLIRFIKINNSRLRESNPSIPTCSEIDSLLQDRHCTEVCQLLAELLNKKV